MTDIVPRNCFVCGNALVSHIQEVLDPLTNNPFSIHKCVRCGLGHTVPQPRNLYHYYSNGYFGKRHGITAKHCVRRRLRFVAAAMQSGNGKMLLDIGCGDGSFMNAAKEAGWDVIGTELHPQTARSAGLDVKESLDQVPSRPPFDCITMWHSLEHMRDIRGTIEQAARLLKQSGKLLIAVPDNGGLQARIFRKKWLHLDVPRHLYHFDAGSLKYCLETVGYSIQRQWHQEFEYDLLGWSQSALNCIMPYPNVYFDCITGKRSRHGRMIAIKGFLFGSLLTWFSLPAVAAGTIFRRGGTLIVAACGNK